MSEQPEIQSKCAVCSFRARAEKNPKSLLSWLWRWHTGWCPGWKAYQKELAALGKTDQA
ncbi:MAG: hypothetical protein JXB47_20280 [Anaerolineae bacterium]|nr:hypothetical protein [Anaerolineae bacterium]